MTTKANTVTATFFLALTYNEKKKKKNEIAIMFLKRL